MVQVHVGATPWRFESSQPHSEPVATLGCACSLPLSSRGLGRRPLTAETGVRIPVAVLPMPRKSGVFAFLDGAVASGAGAAESRTSGKRFAQLDDGTLPLASAHLDHDSLDTRRGLSFSGDLLLLFGLEDGVARVSLKRIHHA